MTTTVGDPNIFFVDSKHYLNGFSSDFQLSIPHHKLPKYSKFKDIKFPICNHIRPKLSVRSNSFYRISAATKRKPTMHKTNKGGPKPLRKHFDKFESSPTFLEQIHSEQLSVSHRNNLKSLICKKPLSSGCERRSKFQT